MRKLAFAICLALGFAAAAPTHTDFRHREVQYAAIVERGLTPLSRLRTERSSGGDGTTIGITDHGDRRAQVARGGRSASLFALVTSR